MESSNPSLIQVVIRARLVLPSDKGVNGFPPDVVVDVNEPEGQVIVGLEKSFGFDTCFDGDSSQETVYTRAVAPLVSHFVKTGAHASILAYGQTGAGKTHTMFGKPNAQGIIPQTIADIFNSVQLSNVSVGVSFFEIHNEKLFDLLNTTKIKVPLGMREEGGQFLFPNLTTRWVSTVEDAMMALNHGCSTRATGSTAQNNASSRSHAIFRITLAKTSQSTGQRIESKLNLVDLAGSESVSKTHAQGERLAEANNINIGLLALGNCISAISRKQSHIPFRNSTLTKVLRECLQGEGHTSIIACISPIEVDMAETLSTLRYADRAKSMKKPPIPAHLLAQAQASSKKRRLAPLIAPTPAKWKPNSTIDNGTPTPRKKTQPRLNTTTPVGKIDPPSFATSTINRRQMPLLEESDEIDDFGSLSDISSIAGCPGPTTSSVISSVTSSALSQMLSHNQTNSIIVDPSTLSPYLRKFAEKMYETMFERFEKRRSPRIAATSKHEENVSTSNPKRREENETMKVIRNNPEADATSSFYASTDETVISGNAMTSARKRTREGQPRRQSSHNPKEPVEEIEENYEDFLSKKVNSLQDLTNKHKKRSILHQVATASPSFGGENLDKENVDVTRTPKRRHSKVTEITTPTLSEMEDQFGLNSPLPCYDFPAPTFSTVSTKTSNVKRATRRTTMLMPDLRKSICESGVAVSRRQSVRLGSGNQENRSDVRNCKVVIAGSSNLRRRSVRLVSGNLEKHEFKNPFQATSHWKVDNQKRHNNNILQLINSANLSMLKSLPAIGPKTAYVINVHRERHGAFKSLEDLKTIPGIQKSFFPKFCKLHQIED